MYDEADVLDRLLESVDELISVIEDDRTGKYFAVSEIIEEVREELIQIRETL